MVRIENLAKEKLSKKYEVVLPKNEKLDEDIELSLKVTEGHRIQLIDILNDKKLSSGELLKKQLDLAVEILKASYPEQDIETIKSWKELFGEELILEVSMILGYRNRKAVEALVERQNKLIEKLKNGELDDSGISKPDEE
jgi:predicted RNA-binding protein